MLSRSVEGQLLGLKSVILSYPYIKTLSIMTEKNRRGVSHVVTTDSHERNLTPA